MTSGLLGGDSNVVRCKEKRKGGDHNDQNRESFNNTVQDLELIDIQIMDRRFTWSNLRENLSLAKLGRIIVSSY